MQLQFDMTRNFFPLFAAYSAKPENYFKEYVMAFKLNKYFRAVHILTICCTISRVIFLNIYIYFFKFKITCTA